jgi:hypothetical protein
MGAGFWATLPARRAQFRALQVAGAQFPASITRLRLPFDLFHILIVFCGHLFCL